MDNTTYRHYFDIDPDYFPAVNADVISKNPDLWKKFYPHQSFIKLLKDVVDILTRKQKLNIWVEGAYGTGKSHAVLTLKHLLDADDADVHDYFANFNLDSDLCEKFIKAKSGKLITVHRYGSSSILGDSDLIIAIQESIDSALHKAGIENTGSATIKNAIIKFLSDEDNKKVFSIYVKGKYKDLFGGDSVDDIINNLSTYTDQPLRELMAKLLQVRQLRVFTLSDDELIAWIKEVISSNQLKGILFIWDEFTEYFNNNIHRLTGFQKLIELSETEPFCFMPVTHKSESLFSDGDKDRDKILGRFIRPTCAIKLPENMAFKLMGAALQKKGDELIQKEWEDIVADLHERAHDSSKSVQESAKITDAELAGILPIHPYAALMLKYISTSFESNQRSMFDFIKNDHGEEIKGFQWFIDNISPLDNDNPFLTIDMLWGFFYDMGKEGLAHNIRLVLDYYPRLVQTKKLDYNECRILKSILLFQAISMELDDAVELFYANERNLNNAFEGTDMGNGEAVQCAEKLVRDGVVYKKKMQGDKFVYSILTGELDAGKMDESKKKFQDRTTSQLIVDGQLNETIVLPAALKLRYQLDYAGLTDFESTAKKAIAIAEENKTKLYAVVTMAKDDNEATVIIKKIQETLTIHPETNVIFIDASKSSLGQAQFKEWVEQKGTSSYYAGKDNSMSKQYESYAEEILRKWKQRIANGQFVLYSTMLPSGETKANVEALIASLTDIDFKTFPLCLEHYKVHDTMWMSSNLPLGAECGAMQDLKKGIYNNPSLPSSLAGAWCVDDYWEKSPSMIISRIKIALDNFIGGKMKDEGRISIRDIYDYLKDAPYGFMPCNFTAFILGFLLKEYYNDGKYTWSDGLSSDELSLEKFKDMIANYIKNKNTQSPRYRDNYIVTMTPEEKSFIESTSKAFNVSKSLCISVEQTRERIRARMKELGFPIWTLLSILDKEPLQSDPEAVKEVVNLYCGIANNDPKASGKSDNDIALEIGKICSQEKTVADDLRQMLTNEKCQEAMVAYLSEYNGGALLNLAKEINDDGQYINAIRTKFDADAANWVWKQETVDRRIDEVILEYRIAQETGQLFSSCKSYDEATSMWNEKCANFHLSYHAVRNEVGDLDALLSKLYELRKTGNLQDTQKKEFLENIKSFGTAFKNFYVDQYTYFLKVADFYLGGLNDADKENIFKQVPFGQFTVDATDYNHRIELLVAEYKKKLDSQKLKNLWKKKTGTESPKAWSQQYRMPIIIMIPEEQIPDYRNAFNTMNQSNPDSKHVESAIVILENATFWNDLNDPQKRDAAFVKHIIGDSNAVMLTDIKKVKEFLANHITDSAYNWYDNPLVAKQVAQLARSRYDGGGYSAAFQRIDEMPADKVKQYLKELIKNNMAVGIEIIKDK